jgi:hypothetical protein
MSDWKYAELDDRDVLARIEDHFIQPLLSAPGQIISATSKTTQFVGSRSKLEVDRIKKLTKSIVDAEEREKTYGQFSQRLQTKKHICHQLRNYLRFFTESIHAMSRHWKRMAEMGPRECFAYQWSAFAPGWSTILTRLPLIPLQFFRSH